MALVIVADDDVLHREFVETVLRRAGHRVYPSRNGDECLKHMQTLGTGNVDVVITDIFMPEADGVEVSIEICSSFPDVPVIGMTGGRYGVDNQYGRSLKRLGAASILYKPFSANDLLQAIDELSHESE